MIYVDGVAVKDPSTFTWGLQDISDKDAGRTQDTIMHKNRIGQKRKISLGWNNATKEEAARILTLFDKEYIKVKYPDAKSGKDETRTFYVGDRSAPVKYWMVGMKRYSSISFEIIER